jgi:hypothetical protein
MRIASACGLKSNPKPVFWSVPTRLISSSPGWLASLDGVICVAAPVVVLIV